MDATTVPMIGASIVESLHLAERREVPLTSPVAGGDDEGDDETAAWLAALSSVSLEQRRPCMLLPKQNWETSSGKTNSRMLLQGFAPAENASLLMDLALSLAHATPCRRGPHCLQEICQCTAVVLFRPAPRRLFGEYENTHSTANFRHSDTEEEEAFPMPCVARDDCDRDNSQELETHASWDPLLLQRIEVHHVTSVRDILSYLLQVQAVPRHAQPLGGILLENIAQVMTLGRLESGWLPHATAAASESDMAMLSQVFALLIDTAQWLESSLPPSTTWTTTVAATVSGDVSPKWTEHLWVPMWPILWKRVVSSRSSRLSSPLAAAAAPVSNNVDVMWTMECQDRTNAATTSTPVVTTFRGALVRESNTLDDETMPSPTDGTEAMME